MHLFPYFSPQIIQAFAQQEQQILFLTQKKAKRETEKKKLTGLETGANAFKGFLKSLHLPIGRLRVSLDRFYNFQLLRQHDATLYYHDNLTQLSKTVSRVFTLFFDRSQGNKLLFTSVTKSIHTIIDLTSSKNKINNQAIFMGQSWNEKT